MDANELRALADALDRIARTHAMIAPDESETQHRAADYLRAQADALPVPAVPAGWKVVPVEPTREMLVAARDWSIQKNGIAVGNDQATGCFQAMLAAAPAAPQAEPKPTPASGNDLNVYKEMATNYRNDAQAEPKREPLSDEQIAEIQRAAYERAAQECLATAAELRRCADGCTDGRYDWKADGALDCADAIRALGRQHD